ncbi:Gfo/Idh/MocA family oxidoreductase [Pararhodobacter sp. SW119]|uniref:Gfo/Idh/MocA family protein n=1 Tax=Pararhodobacter sp. SW119 TaxID=2780075 RepID=UPI001ADFB527|nr:Gfo/Idh/MocA family oxidoreductase [Pararhodobacter sp. SW119]
MSRFADRSGPIRLGMVGGGSGAFIGAVHRIAARLDGRFALVAGALSSTPERAQASGSEVGLAEDRIYHDYKAMAQREARLKDGIEAVAVVTPNHLHFPVAREFLKRGIHVICDKPLTATMAEARKMARMVEASETLFVLTHNYTGYPLVRQARQMVARGDLGRLRVAQVEYPQDWMTDPAALTTKQGEWRDDPARSGAGGATGDIGTHAFNLLRFVTGQQVEALSADLQSFGPGRRLDDNAHVLLRLADGARGMLWCSQVAPGHENGLRLRVFGDKGGLDWSQENPNRLMHTPVGAPTCIQTRAGPETETAGFTRLPPGHPEGFLEAFANLYDKTADAIVARRTGDTAPPDVPGIADGLEGMAFVAACIRSSERNAAWVPL